VDGQADVADGGVFGVVGAGVGERDVVEPDLVEVRGRGAAAGGFGALAGEGGEALVVAEVEALLVEVVDGERDLGQGVDAGADGVGGGTADGDLHAAGEQEGDQGRVRGAGGQRAERVPGEVGSHLGGRHADVLVGRHVEQAAHLREQVPLERERPQFRRRAPVGEQVRQHPLAPHHGDQA
jgi:hypothetical protein